MTSNGKQVTVTREMLTAVARHLSINWLFVFYRFDPFVSLNKKLLYNWSIGVQWIFFPANLNVSLDFVSSWKTKFTVPLWTSRWVLIVWERVNRLLKTTTCSYKLNYLCYIQQKIKLLHYFPFRGRAGMILLERWWKGSKTGRCSEAYSSKPLYVALALYDWIQST